MTDRSIIVRIDDRIRLMSAILAGTDWPDKAQKRKGHRPHVHARNTAKLVAEYTQHPAVVVAQDLMNKSVPLEALYTYILRVSWPELSIAVLPPWVPPQWNEHLRFFYEITKLQELWMQDVDDWDKSTNEATTILKNVNFYDFLKPFVGDIGEQLVYMPNISYPSDIAVGVRVGGELLCIGPPRIAWGDNPPWPFDEDKGHIFSTSLSEYSRLLLFAYLRQNADQIAPVTKKGLPVEDSFKKRFPSWGDQFIELVVPGIVALFLEKHVNLQEAQAFILMERKTKGVTILPGVVSVLRRYLDEYEEGNYSSFTDYLPRFPGHLRVAKGISSI